MDEDDFFFMHVVIQDLEDAEEEVENQIQRNYFHSQAQCPLETLSEQKFTRLFRLDKQLCRDLINDISEILNPEIKRRSALTLKTKVLVALFFYAHGSYQAITGLNFFCGVSQPSVSRCVNEITEVLNNEAFIRRWIHFPINLPQLTERRRRFYQKTAFPGAIGVIDCTHVAIVAPNEDEHIYVNRKNYHSLNVQLICDEDLNIMHVNASFPGSTHDAHIWRQSNVSQVMEQIHRQDPQNPFLIMGDSGYPLRPWLIIPLRNPLPGTPEERFNNHFTSIRSTIERCNGVLKNRFRCLLRHRVLHYTPLTAARIVKACAVLHNICTANRIVEPPLDDEVRNADFGMIPLQAAPQNGVHWQRDDDLNRGRQLRQHIINNHYN